MLSFFISFDIIRYRFLYFYNTIKLTSFLYLLFENKIIFNFFYQYFKKLNKKFDFVLEMSYL